MIALMINLIYLTSIATLFFMIVKKGLNMRLLILRNNLIDIEENLHIVKNDLEKHKKIVQNMRDNLVRYKRVF
jgi:hypothetical protein